MTWQMLVVFGSARIVENHGGTLQFQTELNRGTTFGVVLPMAQPDET